MNPKDYIPITEELQKAINTSWNEAEEIHSGLNEMTSEEIIECKQALSDRAYNIMGALNRYAESEDIQNES